jgi:hypothetical protein
MIQKLKLADKFFPAVYDGDKVITIRKVRRDIHLGPLILEATDDPNTFVTVEVWRVLWKRFADISIEDIRRDGGTDHESFLEEMREFYPDMDWQDEVTIIEWLE